MSSSAKAGNKGKVNDRLDKIGQDKIRYDMIRSQR